MWLMLIFLNIGLPGFANVEYVNISNHDHVQKVVSLSVHEYRRHAVIFSPKVKGLRKYEL